MEKHTPGPWYVNDRKGPGWITSEVCYGENDECITDGVYEKADAHLIAASPDMRAALDLAVEVLEIVVQGHIPGGTKTEEALTAVQDAIAKSEGQGV